MAITSNDPRNPRIMPRSGIAQIVSRYQEVDSESFKAGEMVQFVGNASTKAITVAVTGDNSVAGIALKDATNVTSGNIVIPIQLIGPDDEVLIQVEDGSGNLEAANTTCLPGVAYDIITASNHTRLNSSDTTAPTFVFIEAMLDAAGDATYWARVRPLYSEVQITAEGA